MRNDLFFSSATDKWETPQALFYSLDSKFHFTLDVCATADNAKCPVYFSPVDDGLKQVWTGNVWCNPPYGRDLYRWVEAAFSSALANVVVLLLPARTDTKWFHDFVVPFASEVRFLRGRLKFGGSPNFAPFPSMVVVYKPCREVNS